MGTGRSSLSDGGSGSLREVHLVPLGNHVFGLGWYRNGRLAEIYPDRQVHFLVENGKAQRIEFIRGERVSCL